jgi:hypothetical protein
MDVPSGVTVAQARRWRIRLHSALLAAIEWLVAWLLLSRVTREWLSALDGHPLGSDALLSEQGRIALDVTLPHLLDLRAGAIGVALVVVVVLLLSVPLHGVGASLALNVDENPWLRSISRTPKLVAIALIQWLALAVCLALIARACKQCVTLVLERATHADFVLPALLLSVSLYALQCVRVFTHLARLRAMSDVSLRCCLRDALLQLRARVIRGALLLTALDLTLLALTAISVLLPAWLLLFGVVLVHYARVRLPITWLAHEAHSWPTLRGSGSGPAAAGVG